MNTYDIRFPAFSGETIYCQCFHNTANEAALSVISAPEFITDFENATGRKPTLDDITATLVTQ